VKFLLLAGTQAPADRLQSQ